MLIYLALIVAILLYGGIKKWDTTDKRRRKYLTVAFAMIIVIASVRNYTVGTDLRNQYARFYTVIGELSWSEWSTLRFEWAYFAYCKLLNYISSNVQFFIASTAFLTLGSVGYFIYKNSEDVVMSTFGFIALCQMYMYYTGIRQVLAMSVFLIASEQLKKRSYIKYSLGILLASMFHTSAVIGFLLIPISLMKFRRKGIAITCGSVAVTLFGYSRFYNSILNIFPKYNEYGAGSSHGSYAYGNVNFYSLLTVSIIITGFLVVLVGLYRYREELDGSLQVKKAATSHFSADFMIYSSMLAMIFQMFVLTVNILTRFRFYFIPFLYVFLPGAINRIPHRYQWLIKQMLYLILFVYFVYVTVKCAESQWGVVPFEVFW